MAEGKSELKDCVYYEKKLVEVGNGQLFPLCRVAKSGSGDRTGSWKAYSLVCRPGHVLTDTETMKQQADEEARVHVSMRKEFGVGVGETMADMENLSGNTYGRHRSKSIGAMHMFMSMDVGRVKAEEFLKLHSCDFIFEEYEKDERGERKKPITCRAVHVQSAADLIKADRTFHKLYHESHENGHGALACCLVN